MAMKGEGGRAGEIDEGEGRRQALREQRSEGREGLQPSL